MGYHFFAYLARLKLINRWSLMRASIPENVQEHSLQVAMVAHALGIIGNKYFSTKENPAELCVLAVFHDAGEVITGDLPTPVKYYNAQIQESYGQLEEAAKKKLLGFLPENLQEEYGRLFFAEKDRKYELVKAADKICAYLKCVEEGLSGNGEFARAAILTHAEVEKFYYLPEVKRFMEDYASSFSLTLDELGD